jgi:trans-aconitate 2-methyltransferase
MVANRWNPDTYREFAELRSRPFWQLVGGLDTTAPIRSLVDLGCGSGELTTQLARRLDVDTAVGIDSSPEMLACASVQSDDVCSFVHGDIGSWSQPESADLVIANASLQWVPDHSAVMERWVRSVRVGGQIAVQVPANGDHPSHTCSAAVAEREPFRSALGGTPPTDPVVVNVMPPEWYAQRLFELGVADPHVRLVVYPQIMESTAQVVDWTRGTSLTRFFTRLPNELHDPFVAEYRDELLAMIGDGAPYFYAFKRILMSGTRDR